MANKNRLGSLAFTILVVLAAGCGGDEARNVKWTCSCMTICADGKTASNSTTGCAAQDADAPAAEKAGVAACMSNNAMSNPCADKSTPSCTCSCIPDNNSSC